jgi:hypothetical protein
VARVIQFQRNPWASQAGLGGEEPQRSDLWVVDLSSVIRGISTVLNTNIPPIPSYFAQSVTIPERRVKAEEFRRDSRPYNMPSFDEAPEQARIVFTLDAAESGRSSRIYSLLDKWRSVVRAGRGAMSKEFVPRLNDNYRIDFQYNVTVMLLKGGQASIQSAQNPTNTDVINQALAIVRQRNQQTFTLQTNTTNTAQKQVPQTMSEQAAQDAEAQRQAAAASASTALLLSNAIQLSSVDNDLQIAGVYTLQNCWLGGFRLNEFSYNTAQVSTIEASFYVEDVFDQNTDSFE